MNQVSNFSVLVVNDEWDDMKATAAVLRGINGSVALEPIFVATGRSALRLASAGYVPDLLLIDLAQDGELTGVGVIRALWEVIGEEVPAAVVAPGLISGSIPSSIKVLHKPLSTATAFIRAWIRSLDLEKSAQEMPSLSATQ